MPEHTEAAAVAPTSEAEEMYLITCARALEEGVAEPIPLARLSADLGVSTVSANQMVKKMEARHLVRYAPYKGVFLTDGGRAIAEAILRRRRLWGVFLWEQLGLDPLRADDVACDMEHITPDDVADRLAAFLGQPAAGPTGRRIPDPDGGSRRTLESLSACAPGSGATVASVEGPADGVGFLRSQGLDVGGSVTVVAVGGDGSLLVETSAGMVHLAAAAVKWIRVEPRP